MSTFEDQHPRAGSGKFTNKHVPDQAGGTSTLTAAALGDEPCPHALSSTRTVWTVGLSVYETDDELLGEVSHGRRGWQYADRTGLSAGGYATKDGAVRGLGYATRPVRAVDVDDEMDVDEAIEAAEEMIAWADEDEDMVLERLGTPGYHGASQRRDPRPALRAFVAGDSVGADLLYDAQLVLRYGTGRVAPERQRVLDRWSTYVINSPEATVPAAARH